MTVISTVITRHCTAHASDSLLTVWNERTRTWEIVEEQQSKIIPVRHWRGAMGYWGLASKDDCNWSTYDWLQEQADKADEYDSAEEFALGLKDALNGAISKMDFDRPLQAGIGIHLTVYESVQDCWIPELFLLSNLKDPSYTSLHLEGVLLTRQTYNNVFGEKARPEHREDRYRLKVYRDLHETGRMLFFNNGDPEMFNPVADAILELLGVIVQRGIVADLKKPERHRHIVRRPIEVISKAQLDFCEEGHRIVGGEPHDLSITPDGQYGSCTGDAS